MKKKLTEFARSIFRIFVVITKDSEGKVYHLKHTPFSFRTSFRKKFEKKWGALPIVENRIVVDNYMGKGYGCNGKYVTEELLKEPEKYDIVWVVDDIKRKKDQFPEGVRLVQYLSPEACEAYATAKVWLCNFHMVPYINVNLLKKPRQAYIQMWHGSLGIKKIEGDSHVVIKNENWTALAKMNAEMTDYWISNSDFESKVFHDAFWGVDKILTLGHARNDPFFRDPQPYLEKVRAYLGITETDRFALFVPTHRDETTKDDRETLDHAMVTDALKERFGGNWKLVLRPHPRDMAELLEKHPNLWTEAGHAGKRFEAHADKDVLLAGDYPDIQELLVAADVVITDYSSCIFDYLLTGKPGFLFVTDREEYTQMRGLYYPLTDTPFPVADNNQKLRENILHFSDAVYREKAQKFLQEKGCMDDGHAAERIRSLIDRIIAGERGIKEEKNVKES